MPLNVDLSEVVSKLSAPLFAQFIGSTMWYVLCGVLLVAMIGVLIFVRKKQG